MKKRIFALLLSLCMIFSMVPAMDVSAAGTEVEFTLNKAAWRTNDCLVYLDLAGVTDVSTTTVPDGSKVVGTVDGASMNLWAYYVSASQVFLVVGVTNGNHIVKLPAGTAVGAYTIKNDVNIKLTASGGTQLTPIRLGIDTTKGGQAGMTINNGQSRYEFYITGISGYSSWNEEQTILIDGAEHTGKGESGLWYEGTPEMLYVKYSVLGLGTNEGGSITKTFTIPKGTILGDYITENDLSFTASGWNNLTVHPTEVTLTGVASGGWRSNNSDYYITLNTDDNSFAMGTVADLNTAGVLIDNTAASGWFQVTDNGTLVFTLETEQAEHVVTIPAGAKLGDYQLKTAFTFYTHADGTVNTTPPVDPTITFTFASGTWQASDNRYLAYFNHDLDEDLSVAWAPMNIVSVDGTDMSVYATGGKQLMLVLDSTVGITAQGEHEITLKKGTKIGNYEIANDVTFYTHADGTVNTTPPVKEVGITGVSGSYRSANNDYYITFTLDDSNFALGAVAALSSAGVQIDDAAANGWFQITSGGTLPFTLETEQAEHVVTIPAGAKLGDYQLKSDFTFYTHADGTVNTTPPVKEVGITGVSGSYRSTYSDYYITFTLDDSNFALGEVAKLSSAGVQIDDAAASGWFQITSGGTLPFTLETTQAEHVVTIPAGAKLGDYQLKTAFTFYTHADGKVDVLPPAAKTVSVVGFNKETSKHTGTAYHVFLNTSDAAFVLDTSYNQSTIDVMVDGQTQKVFLWENAEGSFLVDGWTNISLGYHTVTIPAGTAIGDYTLEDSYSFRTYSNGTVGEADRGEVLLNNATAMMGGSYGDSLYYDLSGSFTGSANWIVNATPVEGDITLQYVKNSESAKSVAWQGPARATTYSGAWSVYDNGIVLNMGPTVFANNWGLTNVKWMYSAEGKTVSFHNASGASLDADQKKVNAVSGPGYTDLTAEGLANAQYFGLAWNATDYTIDWTKLMIYDASGNDLGVAWYASDATVKLTPMVEYGKMVYLKAADNNGLTVVGWKVIDREGQQITVEDAKVENGIWSFTVPQDTASIEPIYKTVELTVQDPDGKVLVQSTIAWLSGNIQLAQKQVEAQVPAGSILKGYALGDALYASLEDIPVGESDTKLTVTAQTLAFQVQGQAEVRHGNGLADSGLRFVATLGQSEYIAKVLLVSETAEKLTIAEADWKVGNPYGDFQEIATPDGTVSYSIALTNIPAADYSKTYYARAAVLVTYANGSQAYVYTDTVAATVHEAAQSSRISSDEQKAYVNGVMSLDADAALVGSRDYTIQATNVDGNFQITHTHTEKVAALMIDGLPFTEEDGVKFEDKTITVPGGLFANAKLKKEMTATGTLDIGAYFGPSVGGYQYTESSGGITDYSIPRTHDAVYADVEDYFNAGFNIWMAEDWVYGGTQYGTNDALSALDLAAEYCINHGLTKDDIQVLITSGFINGLLDGTDMNNNDRNSVETYAAIAKDQIQTLIDYQPTVNGQKVDKKYNCFGGFLLRDEPFMKHMEYYPGWFSFLAADSTERATVKAWNTSSEQISGQVNCLGLLSKGYKLYFSMLGMSTVKKAIVANSDSTEPCSEAEYVAYVKAFVDNVNDSVWKYDNMMLAFDNYGLYTQASGSLFVGTKYAEAYSDNWQRNMALFADLVQSKNPNAVFAAALRSMGWTNKSKGNSLKSDSWKEFQNFDQTWGQQAISMQAYTALAHGYSYVTWYTYWEPHNQAYGGETYTDACVMWDDNMHPVKQNMYYWVQSANQEIRSLENLLSNFSYQDTAAIASGSSFYTGTDAVNGTGGLWTAGQLTDKTALQSISVSKDTTVGYYTKDSDQFKEMFVLANMSHPNQKASDTVTMGFDDGYTAVIVYLDGEASIYTLTDGACTVTLPSGEGAIVIPVK